jgi:serine/threonine protein kinase
MRETHDAPSALSGDVMALERIIDRFEEAWQQGLVPEVMDFLPGADHACSPSLLIELVHVDLEYRVKSGRSAHAEDYLRRFPTLERDHPSGSLLAWERELRQRVVSSRELSPWHVERDPELPEYEILGRLGRGSMGIVYKARRVRLNRLCALKMIRPAHLTAPESILRFIVEAEILARLRHPNIVQVYHLATHESRPFIELEYVGERNLASQLKGTPWCQPKAAALVEQIAGAIHEAHRQHIIHRDLKPSNILLTEDGTPKIADFGLARLAKLGACLTESEVVLGTPQYMAPEQAEGRNEAVAAAADIYSLGAILYELLAGRPPFRGETPLDVLQRVKYDTPIPPSRLRPRLSRDLQTVCLKCLSKEPRDRYATALDLAEDLRRYQMGEPVRARPVPVARRVLLWARGHDSLAAWRTLSAVMLMALIVVLLRGPGNPAVARLVRDRADTNGRAPALSPEIQLDAPGQSPAQPCAHSSSERSSTPASSDRSARRSASFWLNHSSSLALRPRRPACGMGLDHHGDLDHLRLGQGLADDPDHAAVRRQQDVSHAPHPPCLRAGDDRKLIGNPAVTALNLGDL